MPRQSRFPCIDDDDYEDDGNNNLLLFLLLMKCNNYKAAHYVSGSIPCYIFFVSFQYSTQHYFFKKINAHFKEGTNFIFAPRIVT